MSSEAKNGPVENEKRHCTDILCCLIFVAYMVLMVYVGSKGLASGDPKKLTRVYDGDGNICG